MSARGCDFRFQGGHVGVPLGNIILADPQLVSP